MTVSDVTGRGPDRKCVLCMLNRFPLFCSYYSSLGRVYRQFRNIRPSGGLLTGNDVIKRDPVGFPWKICKRTCAIGSVFGVFSRTSAYYLPFSSPFTGYLPLSRHFISAFNNYTKVCCFRICSICTPSSLSRLPLWGY